MMMMNVDDNDDVVDDVDVDVDDDDDDDYPGYKLILNYYFKV